MKASENQAIQNLIFINEFKHKEIKMGDHFHVNNMVVMLVSLGAWGDVEKGDQLQNHHRQLMQSIHSLHVDDKPLSQAYKDEVLEGSEEKVVLNTSRERVQQWLVN